MAGLPISFLNGLTGRQPIDNSINSVGSQAGLSVDANTKALMSLLDSLSNGETIMGKVMASKDGMLQIMTGDNIMINAEVADGVSLAEGSTALFEVSKRSDNSVSLRPLYHNLASTATASAALKQAGLPENARTLEMVARNMEYGNPIDRNSLIQAYRNVALYPDVPVKYITDLQKMGIPASDANFEQYEAYLNMENSVSEAFSDIGESIINEINNALAEQISGETEMQGIADETPEQAEIAGKALQAEGKTDPESKSLSLQDQDIKLETAGRQVSVTDTGELPVRNNIVDSLIEFADSLEEFKPNDLSYTREEIAGLASELEGSGETAVNLRKLVFAEDETPVSPVTVFKAALKDIQALSARQASPGPSLQVATDTEVPAEASAAGRLTRLPDSFKALLTKTLSSQWSLDRDEISDKGEVKALYNRLFEQTSKLLGTLSENAGKDSPITRTVQNLSDNLNFMNSLNHYVPYVQIPFRGENGNTGSELYVYKNKRSLAAGDSSVSAFIHLDMENLGPTDVFVKLQDSNVTTKFTLADDSALDLIHDNIDFLNKRLNDKGYSFNAEMIKLDQSEPPISEMLINTTDRLMVSRTSFDARI